MNDPLQTFQPFPKMARLSRECVITEKIDGTNAQVFVWDKLHETTSGVRAGDAPAGIPWLYDFGGIFIAAGSRNKWLTTEKNNDNYGFARWVTDNAPELARLGHGRHFGEWWGAGIQRRYGLQEKRFSLFNVARWIPVPNNGGVGFDTTIIFLSGLTVVPVLFRGQFYTDTIDAVIESLEDNGSVAAPGFMDPEGIVIWHEAARVLFKKTIKDDAQPKSLGFAPSPRCLTLGKDAADEVFRQKMIDGHREA